MIPVAAQDSVAACTSERTATVVFSCPPHYCMLDGGVFLDGMLLTDSGIPFPKRGDSLTFVARPNAQRHNRWDVIRGFPSPD